MPTRTRPSTASRRLLGIALATLAFLAGCQEGPTRPDPDPTPECTPPPSGLIAWYSFDEKTGTTAADLANATARSDLFLRGTEHITGRVQGGLLLASDTAHAAGGANKNVGTGDFSIAFWVRVAPEHGQRFVPVVDKRRWAPIRGYHLALMGGEPLVQLADGGIWGGWYNYHSRIPGTAIVDGQWHFVVVTVERASRQGVRWYLDGVPAGHVSDPTDRPGDLSNDVPLVVGSDWGPGRGTPAAVDELQILNRVLTPAEVSALFARPACR